MAAEEWKLDKRGGVCASCGKAFGSGDVHFSVLYDEEAKLTRRDFCPECWAVARGKGEFSFWRTTVPEPEEDNGKKRRLAKLIDTDTLLDILRETPDSTDPQKMRFRFVIALMLMRRKKLKLVSITRGPAPDSSGPRDVLVLKMTGRGAKKTFDVADIRMSEDEMLSAQDEVGTLLGMTGGEAQAVGGGGAPGEESGASEEGAEDEPEQP